MWRERERCFIPHFVSVVLGGCGGRPQVWVLQHSRVSHKCCHQPVTVVVMKSIISSTTRALLVSLQSTQLIFILWLTDYVFMTVWLWHKVWSVTCLSSWPSHPVARLTVMWTISILTDTEIKYSGVLTSVSLSVSRLSNVIIPGVCQCVVSLGVSHSVTD